MVKLFLTRVPRPCKQEGIVFSTNGVEKIGYPHTKQLSWIFTKYHRQNLTQNGQNLNRRPNSIKIWEENITHTPQESRFGKNFLDMTSKVQATTTKNTSTN